MEDDPDAEQWLTVAESVCCDANSHIFCFAPRLLRGWHVAEAGRAEILPGDAPGGLDAVALYLNKE